MGDTKLLSPLPMARDSKSVGAACCACCVCFMVCLGYSLPLMVWGNNELVHLTNPAGNLIWCTGDTGYGLWGQWIYVNGQCCEYLPCDAGGTNAADYICDGYVEWSGSGEVNCQGYSSYHTSSLSGDGNICASEVSDSYAPLCTAQWLYSISFALSCLSCCTTLGGAFGPKQVLAGAAALNFCSGLFCMITASYVTSSQTFTLPSGNEEFTANWWSKFGLNEDSKGAPYKANWSYAALWLGWLLGWMV